MLWYRRLTVSGRAPCKASGASMQVNNLVWWDTLPAVEISRSPAWLMHDVFAEWLVSVDVTS